MVHSSTADSFDCHSYTEMESRVAVDHPR